MSLNRRDLLIGSGILSLAGCAGDPPPPAEPAPEPDGGAKAPGDRRKRRPMDFAIRKVEGATPRSVIVIVVDDLRWDALGFLGHPVAKTPNIDRLAKEGAVCANHYVTTSLCSPSRASMLTGYYAHHHGVQTNQQDLPHRYPTYGMILKKAGYETAYVGKWHMGDKLDPRPGWDHWVSFKGQGQYVYPDGQKSKADDRGFQYGDEFREVDGYVTDLLTDEACTWIRSRTHGSPYLCVVSHKAVHAPLVPPKRHKAAFAGVKAPAVLPDTDAAYEGKPKWLRAMRDSELGVDGDYKGRSDPDEWYRNYFRCLLAVDDSVGKLLDVLAERGELDDTAILFTSDNGFMFGEKGILDKRCFYEPSVRVPLVARCPAIFPAGTKVTGDTLNVDLAPTILELAGVVPADDVHGRSLVAPLSGKLPADWRTSWLYEYFFERIYPQTPTVLGVRSGRWKLVTYFGVWDDDELFDLQADPGEEHNLTALQPEKRKELGTVLRDEANRVGCRLLPSWDRTDDDEG